MKRFVIILLAVLSGLSVPQAVAVAAGRSDCSMVAAPDTARADKAVRQLAHLGDRPSGELCRQTDPVALAPLGLAPERGFRFGDRARE